MALHRLVVLVVLAAITTPTLAAEITPEQLQFFEAKIRPVLIRECYGCHSNKAGNVRGGLRLDTRELTHIGGATGPAVVPGDLEESWLYNAITHQDFVMPPKRKLPQSIIDDFRKWIEMGAPDPRVTKVAKIQSSISAEDIAAAKKSFWAYQHPTKHDPPKVENGSWPKTDIDRFILHKLEQAELNPADDAEAWQVLRRLCFDLIGLPPTPEQIEYFTEKWRQDPDDAIAYVVDRLLAKEQFGERWGRHWLDVVRYAESTGREVNMTYPQAWRYRDYVIDSFNDDKPFDRFVQEQIAGDLMPVKTDQQWAENLVATTFLAIGPKNLNEQNRIQFAADLVDEQIDATTRIFLGMSVACARCHDHKFDAIPQTDYYAMAGIFGSTKTFFGNPQSEYGSFSGVQARQSSSLIIMPVEDPNPFDKRYSDQELTALRGAMTDKLQEMSELRRNRDRSSGTDAKSAQRARILMINTLSTLSGRLASVDEDGNPRTYCMGVQERDAPGDARVLVRGEIDQAGRTVPRGFPQVLADRPLQLSSQASGRLELARWIGSDKNSLTARVMVNRIWLHMIGQGLVTSTENYGVTGQPPSHPELLDYLALRFVESNWSVKSVVRDIALSRVYRMKSTYNKKYHEYDPDNALVWRANPRRLDAEAIRDAMLSISGEIEFERPRASEVAKAGYVGVRQGQLGNPLARNRQPGGGFSAGGRRTTGRRTSFAGRGSRQSRTSATQLDMEAAKFRSVYLPIVRDEEPRSLSVFDFADSSAIIGKREESSTADQALYMMNNKFVLQQSESFASRLEGEASQLREQIGRAFLLAYGRPPTAGERSAMTTFVQKFAPTTTLRSRGHLTLSAVCQSLFASAEFRYID